jgi:hypothetical protein
MVRLSPEIEHADFLNALAAERRKVAVTINTRRPLRKAKTATHSRQLAQLREEATQQIYGQLDARGRRAFRDRITVELHLSLPSGTRHDAGLAALVKPYVDLLQRPVVFNDARVDHLLVLKQPASGDHATVLVRCLPLSIFAAEYDRAFRRLAELETIPEPQPKFLDGQPVKRTWGLDRFDRYTREFLHEEERLLSLIRDLDDDEETQLAEDPDAAVDLDVPPGLAELGDAEVRTATRDQLQRSTSYARGDQLTDQGFDSRDRPGSSPAWLQETRTQDADLLELDDQGPGCFVLPAPLERKTAAGEPAWSQLIAAVFLGRATQRPWRHARFAGPLALDIALRGRAGSHMDLDNAAHQVLREFERAFAPNTPSVDGYRVYRRPAAVDDVRVRVLPAIRLQLLSRAMDDARALARKRTGWALRESPPPLSKRRYPGIA